MQGLLSISVGRVPTMVVRGGGGSVAAPDPRGARRLRRFGRRDGGRPEDRESWCEQFPFAHFSLPKYVCCSSIGGNEYDCFYAITCRRNASRTDDHIAALVLYLFFFLIAIIDDCTPTGCWSARPNTRGYSPSYSTDFPPTDFPLFQHLQRL